MLVAYICFYRAYPPASGAASVTYHYAKHTAGDRVLIQLGPDDREEVTPDGVSVVTLRSAEGRLGKIAGIRSTIARITEKIRQIGPQAIVLEGASWVVYHASLLGRLRSLAKATIVYHSHNVEYVLRRQKNGRLVAAVTRWAEGRLLRQVNLATAVSEVDQQQFASLYGVRPEVFPNGVDFSSFDAVNESDVRRVADRFSLRGDCALFMGAYSYRPNREAIEFLVRQVFPRVVEKRPGARLVVMGDQVKLPYNEPWLSDLGNIPHDDLPAVIKACRLGVAPIFSGSGTRLKILEYLAAGLPVVATAKGAEGLGLVDGQELLLAETADGFAQAVLRMLKDRDFALSCASHGQLAVRERFSYDAILDRFHAAFAGEAVHA